MHELLNNQLSLLAGCDLYADVATVWGVFVFDFLTRMKAKKATRNLWPFSHYCLQIAYQQAQHLDYQSLLYWCGGANGTWIMSCRLQPGSDEWCCRCLLWSQRSWRIGGLKGAEIHSKHVLSQWILSQGFLLCPVWCTGKTLQQARLSSHDR